MSRRVGVASLAGCLIWCAAAYATSVHYNGPAAGGTNHAGVEFNAKQANKRPAAVLRFEFHNIPAACTGYAPTAVNNMLTIAMKVTNSRHFNGTQALNGGLEHVTVHGSFSASFKQATGTIRVHGTVSGCRSADTGIVHWTARALH